MAEGQEKLLLAIITVLRADGSLAIPDGSLVPLTEHSVNKMHIGRSLPDVKGRTPFLGVAVFSSVPLLGADVTHLQRARVHFRCSAKSELTAIKIADRLETLLHHKPEDDAANLPNTGFWDFGSADISNRQTRFVSRDLPDFDEDTEVYEILVEADLIWVDQPCPAP